MNNKKRIYCLTPDPDLAARIHWVLQRGYALETFKSVEALSQSLALHQPDLVILDRSQSEIDVAALIETTKKDCGGCVSYLLLSNQGRSPASSLFRCNCIVGHATLPIIPDQLINAVDAGMELSHMCKIRSNIFKNSVTADLPLEAPKNLINMALEG